MIGFVGYCNGAGGNRRQPLAAAIDEHRYPLPLWERVPERSEGGRGVCKKPLSRLNLASLDFATLSHKGRGYSDISKMDQF